MDGSYHYLSPRPPPSSLPAKRAISLFDHNATKPTGRLPSNPSATANLKSSSGPPETNIEPRRQRSAPGESTGQNLEQFKTTSSGATALVRHATSDYMTNPFEHRYGRRFLKDPSLPYPLPVDLAELHRQTLRTLMLIDASGAPFCNSLFQNSAPKKVLELACGSAFWSSTCHDWLKGRGASNVSFVGLDIAPLAPDLQRSGMNWQFVQHDLSIPPLPFLDATFDFVFIKDAGLCTANPETVNQTKNSDNEAINPFNEAMRILKQGGILEVWESDHTFRTLLPHPSIPTHMTEEDIEQAQESATYLISPSTAFARCQNEYLRDYNKWVERALEERGLSATPCTALNWGFSHDADVWAELGCRRLAIPFGEVRWEREGIGGQIEPARGRSRTQTTKAAEKQAVVQPKILTPDQAALRNAALTTTIQFIESLETLLKEASGKRQDEWNRWWASMTNDLLEQNGTFNGECLEFGAWWGRKK
ncbi:hypothetical protein MMC14_006346 [Varicellaria rhodocarpa]|nr:hypothetical protein [Varicellaria rhodocarpa]